MKLGRVTKGEPGTVWIITLPAHQAIKLKRVFPKLGAGPRDEYVLSDTPENARDLQWFLERYEMTTDAAARAYLEQRADEHREQQSLVAKMLSGKIPKLPVELAVPARHYQTEAAALYMASGGLLLADDLGTGKTCTAICSFCDERSLPALVIAPTALPQQWRREISKFAPALRVAVIQGTKPYDLTKGCRRHDFTEAERLRPSRCRKCGCRPKEVGRGPFPMPDVIVTSYSKIVGWAETFAEMAQEGLLASCVFDEAQELRREWGRDKDGNKQRTQKYAAAKLIADAVKYRLGCSATPIYNWGSEFFTVMECIRPGALGTVDEFTTEWCDGAHRDQAEIKDPKAFGVYVRGEGMMLRRTRADIGRELPPLTNVLHKVESDASVLEAVEDRCAELARFLLGKDKVAPAGTEIAEMGPVTAEQKVRGASMKAATELDWRLREATGLSKAPYVAEFVRLLIEGGENKILLFGWHHAVYGEWMKLLGGGREGLADLKPVLHTGRESAKQKEEARAAFIEGDSKVLVMSLRSGAGVDGLQKCCRTIVYGELDPSPGVHEQCSGRPHRDGQTDPVFAYYLVSEDGSDPHLMDLLGLKTGQAEGIRDPERELTEKLTGGGHHVKKLAEAYLAQREKRARARIDAAAL
jgi:SNF2 family DNA or RNA helicase